MIKVVTCIVVQHDLLLVALAGILCGFGSWVTSRLYRHARRQAPREAITWYLLTASTCGVSIWCTHFVAMLGFRPDVPVSFDFALTFVSLLIAVSGSAAGIMISAMVRTRFAPLIGGAILGLAISAMHYAGMIAYRVQGLVTWQEGYLAASIALAVILSAVAIHFGSKDAPANEYRMAGVLTVGIVLLHFTGMTAFGVLPMDIPGEFSNPEAFKILALAIAGNAILIAMGGLFSYAVENRTRMESIAELTAARNAAESASRAKSEFMSVLSHELRTPLTVVLGYAGVLSAMHEGQGQQSGNPVPLSSGAQGEKVALYGRKITRAANHLLGMINEILDYTSIELNEVTLKRTAFTVRELLDEVAGHFAEQLRAKSVTLHIESDDIFAHADRARCRQILVNLVDNALKFSDSRDIFLRARFGKTGFLLQVEDRGRGIAAKDLGRIFQAFQQLEDADTRNQGGTGLGLAICEKLTLAHGGRITVDSKLGKGTTFSIALPASAVAETSTDEVQGEFRMAS